MQYDHTQRVPLHWLLDVSGIGIIVAGIVVGGDGLLPALAVGACLLLVARLFTYLHVWDAQDALQVRFGPFPLFGCRIPYESIREVTPDRSSLIDGWGVHWLPGRGTTYNLWGFDCLRLKVDGRTVRIGTDDVTGLQEFLARRLHQPSPGSQPKSPAATR